MRPSPRSAADPTDAVSQQLKAQLSLSTRLPRRVAAASPSPRDWSSLELMRANHLSLKLEPKVGGSMGGTAAVPAAASMIADAAAMGVPGAGTAPLQRHPSRLGPPTERDGVSSASLSAAVDGYGASPTLSPAAWTAAAAADASRPMTGSSRGESAQRGGIPRVHSTGGSFVVQNLPGVYVGGSPQAERVFKKSSSASEQSEEGEGEDERGGGQLFTAPGMPGILQSGGSSARKFPASRSAKAPRPTSAVTAAAVAALKGGGQNLNFSVLQGGELRKYIGRRLIARGGSTEYMPRLKGRLGGTRGHSRFGSETERRGGQSAGREDEEEEEQEVDVGDDGDDVGDGDGDGDGDVLEPEMLSVCVPVSETSRESSDCEAPSGAPSPAATSGGNREKNLSSGLPRASTGAEGKAKKRSGKAVSAAAQRGADDWEEHLLSCRSLDAAVDALDGSTRGGQYALKALMGSNLFQSTSAAEQGSVGGGQQGREAKEGEAEAEEEGGKLTQEQPQTAQMTDEAAATADHDDREARATGSRADSTSLDNPTEGKEPPEEIEEGKDSPVQRRFLGQRYRDISVEYVLHREVMGSGRYGEVRQCMERRTGRVYACKTIKKELLAVRGTSVS